MLYHIKPNYNNLCTKIDNKFVVHQPIDDLVLQDTITSIYVYYFYTNLILGLRQQSNSKLSWNTSPKNLYTALRIHEQVSRVQC